MNRIAATIAIFGIIALAGCASHPKPIPTAAPATGSAASTTGTENMGTGNGTALGEQGPPAGPQSAYQNRVVYFAFNRSVVKSEYFPLLKKQADYLSNHPSQHIILEGYCDERGTREYNIGLGARRAAAVRNFLTLQGVNGDQIKTISYGEAFPADPEHNEAAWAKNRRVVINFHPNLGRSGTQAGNP
ncbi:MAG: peptidoglycan-associated lipoprotein Pal [Gammaproteobacteria bacterium]